METIDLERLFEDSKKSLMAFDVEIANKEEEVKRLQAERDAVAKIYNAIAPLRGAKRIPTISDASFPPSIDLIQTAGVSVAIRSVLDFYRDENFTASQMRDRLEKHGWDWAEYKNPLSTVHTTLVRLVQSDSAKDTIVEGKKVFYSVSRPKQEVNIDELMKGYSTSIMDLRPPWMQLIDQNFGISGGVAPLITNAPSGAFTTTTPVDALTDKTKAFRNLLGIRSANLNTEKK